MSQINLKVLLAIVKSTGEKVAIKKVFQDRRYKNRELPIMLELHHPNIVELKSYYKTKAENKSDDEFFLNCIMEYVPVTLSHLITQNRRKHTKFDPILLKLFSLCRFLIYFDINFENRPLFLR